MIKENKIKKSNKNSVRENFDFWSEAGKFKKDIIGFKNIDIKFATFCKEKGFNKNEACLFKQSLIEQLAFQVTIAWLKSSPK